jgi:hypothetical protein
MVRFHGLLCDTVVLHPNQGYNPTKKKEREVSNKSVGGRRRPLTIHEMNAEFRGLRNAEALEEVLEEWNDEEVIIEAPKEGGYRFTQD